MEKVIGGDNDITSTIPHPSIFKDKNNNNSKSFEEFLTANEVVVKYENIICNVSEDFTSEIWRRVWAILVYLCYEVRDRGYVLSAETFERENMRFKNGHVKFLKLYGVEKDGNYIDGFYDFVAVAKLIENLMVKHGGVSKFKEVFRFVSLLKFNLSSVTPLKTERQSLIKSHYCIMSDLSRYQFVFQQLDLASNENSKEFEGWIAIVSKVYKNPAKRVSSSSPYWNDSVKANAGDLTDVYNYRSYTNNLGDSRAFIRNCLAHLKDAGYTDEEALKTVSCCFPEVADIQFVFYGRRCFSSNDLIKWRALTYY